MGCAIKDYIQNTQKVNTRENEIGLGSPPLPTFPESSEGFPQAELSTIRPLRTLIRCVRGGRSIVERSGLACGKASDIKQISINDLEIEFDLFKTRVGKCKASCRERNHEQGSSYGLEDLNDNDVINNIKIQKGFINLYEDITKLNYTKYSSEIKAIRNNQSIKSRMWAYEHGMISEKGIYAWFNDLVIRQNQFITIGKEGSKQLIENYGARWNRSRAAGFAVRKRLKGILTYAHNPIMITPTISRDAILDLMPYNTNLEPVMFAILKIGDWIRRFNQNLWHYQKRNNIEWSFKGWCLEFQGEKEDTDDLKYYNRGFPHPHMIYDSKWMGDIRDIQKLWPYGSLELTTKKDFRAKYPGRKFDSLSVANYITKYVTKARSRAIGIQGVHKGLAWLAFTGGRLFSVKHERNSKDLKDIEKAINNVDLEEIIQFIEENA